MITVTINGKKIPLEKPVTILKAARTAGIHIPTLCHDDILEPYGGCRLCLVEVEKVPRLQTSCTQYVTDGMVVWTETERVVEARKAILEFLLINHPLDCPFCDKAGECQLQDLAAKYGPPAGRFAEGKRMYPESYADPLIVRNMGRCILCSKCVRMCDDVQGASAISIVNRGSGSCMEPFSGNRFDCEYCGNCLTVCPVGAIVSRLHRHCYRPWLSEREIETVCSYCGVGCSLVIQMRGNSIIRSAPKMGLGLNRGLLCNRGRFGYDHITSSDRVDTPLIRRDGILQQATWEEAITFAARRLKEIREDKGGDAIAGIASGRCTNEDAYVFQKFFRGVIGTNNVDSSASLAYGPAQRFFEKIFGQGITANHIHGISNSDGIVVIGGDPTSINPVLGLQIRSAYKKGVPVVSVGHAAGMRSFSDHRLAPNAFTETVLLAALVSEIRNKKPFSGERPFFEEIIKGLQPVSLKDASYVSGIRFDELVETVNALTTMSNPSIIIGRNIVQTTHGHMNLLFIAALAYLLNGRIYLLSELPNEQGVLDMGCQPDTLPCGRPLTVEMFRKRCGEFLGIEIPSAPGHRYTEIIEAAHAGRITALYVMGDNIALALPDTAYVKDALNTVEFLVVQDSFLTETAQIADVVLPAPSWAEKEGSYTNLERRIQFTAKAIDGKGVEGWKTITELSRIFGRDFGYRDGADIVAEIARVSSLYKDVTCEDIKSGTWLWPYKGGPLRHDMHIEGVERPDMIPLMKQPDLSRVYVYRDVCLFHSENSSRYSSALKSICPEPYAKISKALADRLSLMEGDSLTISHVRGGGITVSAQIDASLPENVVLVPNFEDGGVFAILKWNINPVTGTPALDGNEVLVTR